MSPEHGLAMVPVETVSESTELFRRAIQAVLPRLPADLAEGLNLTARVRKRDCISVEISFRKDKTMKP